MGLPLPSHLPQSRMRWDRNSTETRNLRPGDRFLPRNRNGIFENSGVKPPQRLSDRVIPF